MSLISKVMAFFAGEAAGIASAEVVKPAFEPTRQNAWSRRPYAILDPGEAAEADARNFDGTQTFESLNDAGNVQQSSSWTGTGVHLADDARREGFGSARWDVKRRLARKVPPYPEVLKLWRRERINETTVDAVLDWEAIPAGLRPALKELLGERLDPAEIANAVQQSFVPNQGILPPIEDGPPFDIPREIVQLDTLKEFKAAGINSDRAKVMAFLSGNPPSPEQLAEMNLRSQITDDVAIDGLREGRTKTKWAKAVLYYLTHPLLNPGTLVNRRLRNYDTPAEFHRRMALHGYTATQADDWWESVGRPAAPGQMATAAARGIDGPDGTPMDYPQFRQGILESDIKEKYARMLWESRFLYPSLFQLNRLVAAGAITTDIAADWATKAREAPEVVAVLRVYWDSLGGSKADPRVAKAEQQLWTNLHRSFVNFASPESTAREGLTLLDVPAAAQDTIIFLWTAERDLVDKWLTPAQLKKAYAKAETNPATGAAWTRDEALARLIDLGYSANDAASYLAL